MLIGHIGVGLSLKKIKPEMNVGWLIFLSLSIDLLVGALLLLEIESIILHSSLRPLDVTPYLHVYHDAQPFVFGICVLAIMGLLVKPLRNNAVLSSVLLCIALLSFHLSFNWLLHETAVFNRPLDIKIAFDVIFLGAGALMYWSVPLLRRTQWRILLFIGFVCGISVINHFYGTFTPTHPDLALELILQSLLISSVVLWLDDQPTLATATK